MAALNPGHVTFMRPNLNGVSASNAAAAMAAFTAAILIRCDKQ